MADDAKLLIFELATTVMAEPEFLPDGRPVQPRLIREAATRISEVSADTLRKSMGSFFAGIEELLESAPNMTSSYWLDKVEIHCQVSADGKVGVAGIGMGIKGDTGIKFVLQRDPST